MSTFLSLSTHKVEYGLLHFLSGLGYQVGGPVVDRTLVCLVVSDRFVSDTTRRLTRSRNRVTCEKPKCQSVVRGTVLKRDRVPSTPLLRQCDSQPDWS